MEEFMWLFRHCIPGLRIASVRKDSPFKGVGIEMMASVRVLLVFAVALLFPCFLHPAPQRPKADESSGQPRFDGPAELPRVQVRSALADTPAPGRTRLVKESDNLQDALNDAKCGDTVKLQAGATFRGIYHFPQKSCDDSHWIIIRTSASDDTLPPEGTRVTPCYAGVASLPGRPDFHCPSPRNVMAKIELDVKAEAGPIAFMDGANHYRLIGLEITRAMPELHLRNLVHMKDPEDTAHHLVFDRLWVHGTARDETKGGVHLSGTYVAIVDSYFSDFHCISKKGSCTDAQAINGGIGDAPEGPYKIENNFLEASGQSVMFGGGPGTTTPADIEIRRNHLFKPLIWKADEPGFVGAYTGDSFIIKNNFELKNAQRVLFEGNVLENSWGGYSQTGFSILLAPGNQGGHCPQCRVTDVTIRYCRIRNVASGIVFGTGGGKLQVFAAAAERYSIHDLLVDDIKGKAYKGFGLFAIIISNVPPIKDVHIDHVTAFPPRAILTVINRREKLPGLSITNSIFDAGERQIASAGGGPENCALQREQNPERVLNLCFANPVFAHNLIIGGYGAWPDHNILAKNADAAGLWKKQTPMGTEYRICREKGEAASCTKTSPALRSGSDGKDIGADIEAIDKATAGVI
jgi:hypothetical protein